MGGENPPMYFKRGMSVKVIDNSSIKKYIIKCEKCNAVIEFNEFEEEYSYSLYGYYGESESWFIKCPICKSKVYTRMYILDEYNDFRIST